MQLPDLELESLKFLDEVTTPLRGMRDPQKALRHTLKATRNFFGAAHGCIAVARAGQLPATIVLGTPKGGHWDRPSLGRFVRYRDRPWRGTLILAPVDRRGGPWGVIALARPQRPFERHDGQLLARIALVLSDALQQMDQERLLGVRDRIDRKLLEQIHPKDLFYQILDGLRSLTHYDHSSALLMHEEEDGVLRLVAEQIAWTKAKSERIGLSLVVQPAVRAFIESGHILGFDRRGDRWHEWTGKGVSGVAELIDYSRPGDGAPPQASLLCAPLVTRDGIVGLLKIAACHPGQLRLFDANLVDHFRLQAAIAIQNLHRTESLHARMLTAERKHALAELARTVAHDVNNALGSMLPLIQQVQDDLRHGLIEPAQHTRDLDQVHQSLQVCRRIFGGMLAFARGGARRVHHGHVRPALDTALAILADGVQRRGIELVTDVPDSLPAVACGQGDLEQVFLNLLTNAREASRQGGRISVSARPAGERLDITIADTGAGISAEHLSRVLEPFFTTKTNGNGLGLNICRAILWEVGGSLSLQSEPGVGTRVDVAVPWAAAQVPAQGA